MRASPPPRPPTDGATRAGAHAQGAPLPATSTTNHAPPGCTALQPGLRLGHTLLPARLVQPVFLQRPARAAGALAVLAAARTGGQLEAGGDAVPAGGQDIHPPEKFVWRVCLIVDAKLAACEAACTARSAVPKGERRRGAGARRATQPQAGLLRQPRQRSLLQAHILRVSWPTSLAATHRPLWQSASLQHDSSSARLPGATHLSTGYGHHAVPADASREAASGQQTA